ncbi:hypothetical protein Sste5346_004753 [Sporothrix stenoceras]|uniref:Zn(2)-C6 fungal-type domain-containing protein n=1 Tax=Sporothrix stenoceras TaxID=5173 RepID=A0ABR3Z967_9PEZI
MSSNGGTSAAAAAAIRGGGRVLLACDSCRQRKSRCDGLRPRCSHCVQSGRTCLYRPTPTNLESDASVLARLADTEARLQALEEKNRMLLAALPTLSPANALAASVGAPVATAAAVGGSPQSMELFHHQQQQHHHLLNQHQQYQQQQQNFNNLQNQSHGPAVQVQQPDSSTPHEKTRAPPDLHTAAAFKLLTCWPRLTINMTIPQLDTQTYLTRCDQADPLLVLPGDGTDEGLRLDDTLAPWQASLALEQLYAPNVLQNLPVGMVALLEAVPILQRDHVVASFAEAINNSNNNGGSTSVSVSHVSDPMDADMDVMDEMTVAAATQLQQFHGGSTHNTNGDSMYDRQHRPHQLNGHQQQQQQQQHRRLGQQPPIDYDRMSFAQLLMLSIGIRTSMGCRGMEVHRQRTPFDPPSRQSLMALSAHTCSLALQKLWMLQAGPTEELVPLVLLLAHYLADFWVRPFHARGLLRSIDPAIKHMAMLQADDPLVTLYARLHFTLESDIITELNGFCTLSSAALLAMPPLETAGASSMVPVSSLLMAASPPTPSTSTSNLSAVDSSAVNGHQQHNPNPHQQRPPQRSPTFHVENHVRLRILLNRILHLLYAPTKAYAQPHELADIVSSLTAGLRTWYQAQPPDQQFVRDATVFSINQPSAVATNMSLRLRETALRYFGCVFLLHRPVLYFFLHKDLEYTVRPPENVRTLHVDREPWVLESCRDCIESAALLIHLSCLTPEERGTSAGNEDGSCVEDIFGSWCNLQMLFAAYLILLQVRSVPSLMPVFRNIGDMDALLDKVERAFTTHPIHKSLVLDKTLAILQDERRNFEAASPLAHMT